MILRGEKAFIDPVYRKRSFIEAKLVEVIEKCWTDVVDQRPTIFQIVLELREIKIEWAKLVAQNKTSIEN
jgi:hypothetical protein